MLNPRLLKDKYNDEKRHNETNTGDNDETVKDDHENQGLNDKNEEHKNDTTRTLNEETK